MIIKFLKWSAKTSITPCIKIFLTTFFTIFAAIFTSPCFANIIDRTIYNQNLLTPEVIFQEEIPPEKFNPNNNLARPIGSYYFAKGEGLIVEGIVTDLNDIPIEGVKINVWQSNADGYYQNKIDDDESQNIDPNFMETATAITDSLGRYMFLSIIPGKIKSYPIRCPHVNFVLSKNDIKPMQTKLFFKPITTTDCNNDRDFKVLKLKDEKRNMLEQDFYYIDSRDQSLGKRVVFNIKLNHIQQTKDF